MVCTLWIVVLMLVKYASFDIKSAVGIGVIDSPAMVVNGLADNVLGLGGSPTSKTTSESVLTFGIENLFGNIAKFLDGIFYGSEGLYTKPVENMSANPKDDSELISKYDLLMTNPASASGYISGFIYDADKDYLLVPSSTMSSCLEYFSVFRGARLFYNSTTYGSSPFGGLFYFDSNALDTAHPRFGVVGIDI